jgi:ketosteroid isomerase-like protein
MSKENVEVVRGVYDAVARSNSAAVLAFYDPEVEWDFTRGPLGRLSLMERGVYHGHQGLRSWVRERYEAWENIEDDLEELIEVGDHVISVVTTRGRGRASGAEVEMKGAGLWTIRDGKIARVVWFASVEEALEAAGLSE